MIELKKYLMMFLIVLLLSCNTLVAKNDKSLPGIQPVNIYLNMENKGFKTTKNFSSENGCTWRCKYISSGIDYLVDIYSSDASSVETVQATAMLTDVVNKNIIATKDFIIYVSSIPYDGSNPQKVTNWVLMPMVKMQVMVLPDVKLLNQEVMIMQTDKIGKVSTML